MSLRNQLLLFATGVILLCGSTQLLLLHETVRRADAREADAWRHERESALRVVLEREAVDLLARANSVVGEEAFGRRVRSALENPSVRESVDLSGRLANDWGIEIVLLLRADGRVLSSSVHPSSFDRQHPRAQDLASSLDGAPLVWLPWTPEPRTSALGATATLRVEGERVRLVMGHYLDADYVTELGSAAGWENLSWVSAGRADIDAPSDWQLFTREGLTGVPAASPSAHALGDLQRDLVSGWAVVFAIALLAALLWSRRVARPLVELERIAVALRAGERSIELPAGLHGEAGAVARALRELGAELDEAERRLRSAERRGAWREIARRIAHEIKNTLSPLSLAVDNLETATARPSSASNTLVRSSIQVAREQLASLNRLVGEFRSFAQGPALHVAGLDANALLGGALDAARHAHPDTNFERLPGPTLPGLRGDAEQLRRALSNLLLNAAEAGTEHVELAHGEIAGSSLWWIAVRDRGPGLPEDLLRRLGEPYPTTKPHGTGLGLAIVHQIAEAHGGRFHARNRKAGGCEMRLELEREPGASEGDGDR